jgi:hypothetical protein
VIVSMPARVTCSYNKTVDGKRADEYALIHSICTSTNELIRRRLAAALITRHGEGVFARKDGNNEDPTHSDSVHDIVKAELSDEGVELEEKRQWLSDTTCRISACEGVG